MHTTLRRMAWSIGIVALTACGGGGSGGTQSAGPELVSGFYRYVALEHLGATTMRSVTARVQSDGESQLALLGTFATIEGLSTGPTAGGLLAYGVSGPRVFTLESGRGRVSADGAFAAACTRDAATQAYLGILVRDNPAPVFSDLVGTWLVVDFSRNPGGAPSQFSALRSEVTIQADGTWVGTTLFRNTDGSVLNTPGVVQASNVSINAALVSFFNGRYLGGISADGNLIVLSGERDNDYASLRIMVRREYDPNTIAFAGPYDLIGWQSDTANATHTSHWGRWDVETFISATTQAVINGALEGPTDDDLSFVVDADGVLQAGSVSQNGPQYRGAFIAGGAVAVFGGGEREDNRPTLGILIR